MRSLDWMFRMLFAGALLTPACFAIGDVGSTEPPLPPGYVFPAYSDPGNAIDPANNPAPASLEITGKDQVRHRVNLDPSPLGWADQLLEVTCGGMSPWQPLANYGVFWNTQGCGVTVLLGGEPHQFNALPTPTPGTNPARSPAPSKSHDDDNRGLGVISEEGSGFGGAALVMTDDGLAATLNGRRYHFVQGASTGGSLIASGGGDGGDWRLVAVEFLTQPGRVTRIAYDNAGRPAEIIYPNQQKAVFDYGRPETDAQGPVRLRLPFDKHVAFERDDRGYLTSLEVFVGEGAGKQSLQSYHYERHPDGKLFAFTDEYGLRRVISVETSEGGNKSPPATTVVIRYDADGSYRFRQVYYANHKKDKKASGWRFIEGYGEPNWPVPMAVDTYRHREQVLSGKIFSDASARPERLSPRGLIVGASVPRWNYELKRLESESNENDAGSSGASDRGWAATHFGGQPLVELDELGRVKAVRDDPKADPVATYTYDARGDLVEARMGKARFVIRSDEWGRLHGLTLPDGTSRRWVFDEAGHLIQIAELRKAKIKSGLDESGEGEANALFAMKPEGQGLKFPAETRLTTIGRDPLGRIVEIAWLDGGKERFTFDRGGRLSQMTQTPGGSGRWSIRYDAMRRVSQRQDGRGNRDDYRYHANGQIAKHTFDPPGREREVKEFDLRGRLVAETTIALGRVAYEYDEKDRVTRIVYSDGTDTIQTFDELNRVVAVRGTHQPPVDISYDQLGRPNATPASVGKFSQETGARGTAARGGGG